MSPSNSEIDHPTQRDPRTYPCGAYIADDLPGPFNSGTSFFHWYASWAELADDFRSGSEGEYLQNHLSHETITALAVDLRTLLEGLEVEGRAAPKVLARVNDHLSGFHEIVWLGTFNEICNSDEQFPRQVRAAWRWRAADSEEEPSKDSSALQGEELDQFVEDLPEYGM
jgi:hypothetical protein